MARHAYEEVQTLIKRLGGSMDFRLGGDGGGGTWTLELHGKTARLPRTERRANEGAEKCVDENFHGSRFQRPSPSPVKGSSERLRRATTSRPSWSPRWSVAG